MPVTLKGYRVNYRYRYDSYTADNQAHIDLLNVS